MSGGPDRGLQLRVFEDTEALITAAAGLVDEARLEAWLKSL